jgi:hypothetical protein
VISDLAILLWGVAALLGASVLSIALSRRDSAIRLVYVATLCISAALFVVVASRLIADPKFPLSSCRLGCPGSGPISGWTRSRHFSLSS